MLIAALSAPVLHLHAQDVDSTTFWKRIKDKTIYERVWSAMRIYENEDNKVIQAFSIIGRYHGQQWWTAADQGYADGWENRRWFVGAEAVLFRDFSVHAQMKIRDDFSPVYDELYEAFAKWEPNGAISVSVGRLDWLWTGYERSTSSNRIPTFERGLLANQLTPGEVVGTVAQGDVGKFSYRTGVFSGSVEEEFTHFAGGAGAMAGVGHALPLFYQKGSVHVDYLYNNGNVANNAFKPYDHIVSVWHEGRIRKLNMAVDFTAAHGLEDHKPVYGLTLLPTFDIKTGMVRTHDDLQAVLRYQYAASDGANGLQLQRRYEDEVATGALGDGYHAVYGGLNYLIYENRFKVMSGAEYSVMRNSLVGNDSYKGWTYMAGVRVFF